MALSKKRIGVFWREEQVTLVEFEKNVALQVVTSPLLDSKVSSPFSSNLTEEIQINAVLQKMFNDYRLTGGSVCLSLSMKDIILRSFIIPFVQKDDIQNAIRFEAKKYLPLEIQDLSFVYHAAPFTENKVKRLQVIFFAVRKESLFRYQRIFKQANIDIAYCEPCVVSLAKVLLFKKEIKPTDHLAFLILDKTSGSICFIDQGIPQFVREFSFSSSSPSVETPDFIENLNLRIVNEVGNSFDFYARQFGGEKIDQMLVSSETVSQALLNALEADLKLKFKKVSSLTMGAVGQGNNLDSVYAMGACVDPPITTLAGFDFLKEKPTGPKSSFDVMEFLMSSKEIALASLICLVLLAGVYAFFQVELKVTQRQYDQLSSKQGANLNVLVDSVQAELKGNTEKLATYKNIRTKSDMALIVFRIASHLPQGAMLKELNVGYEGDTNDSQVNVDMEGQVYKEDPNEQITVVNRIYSDLKNDKELMRFIKNVTISLNLEESNGRQVTGFKIHCS